MTVYVDPILDYGEQVRRRLGHAKWCHLTADTVDELHAFAARLGLRRAWFQHGGDGDPLWHYDLTPGKRAQAVRLGAVQVDHHEMGPILAARSADLATDAKRTENRQWATSYRGPLAIHAGQGVDEQAWHGPHGRLLHRLVDPDALPPGGAVVAVARLVDCHRDAGCCRPWGEPGVWHWSLDQVRALPRPVTCRGARRLWRVPADVAGAVRRQLAEGSAP